MHHHKNKSFSNQNEPKDIHQPTKHQQYFSPFISDRNAGISEAYSPINLKASGLVYLRLKTEPMNLL